ncbi:MAG TPA: L-threonylcarbamoyladenylate synthase [Amaricoccus sp.]|uniref:L-threonylcarbamoyladenylate synthase n=2 Tax=Amaricoccus sp. TaxID=1872485 RepID=UPI002CC53FD6|nr:L-threonylcarbamoyladenylate synthase [Amaricoccus sp.]HMR53644.1 L-threonylcarbamoyladenylate synthase [Amaricoccus sp.]HMU00682.1 L-threonylcarbamoyladenylate synthase [Amaricoccus sp.]
MAEMNTVILSDSARGLRAAAGLLRAGQLVAFPTETVYGLGANARDDRAVARIFTAKGRPVFNPLIVHVPDAAMALELAEFSPAAEALARRFWPGPLTLVLTRRPETGLSGLATAGLDTVALRVPAHPLAHRLLEEFGGPLAAPSANPSGGVSPTTRAHVLDGLDGAIAAVLDGGACPVGLESTIVGFDRDTAVLLRPGGLPVEEIAALLGRPVDTLTTRHVTAPGQLQSHYAPRATLRLDAAGAASDEIWLGFGPVASLRPGLNLSERGDLVEAAANLFAHLRAADALAAEAGLSRIAVAPVPDSGLGLGINDRLRRAAAPRF